MKSELISWPVTLVILVVAFGSLVAAGLPLMLTIVGLVAAAGSLYLGTLIGDISIWALNFALMFALALGIDYALFLVVRFRAARFGDRKSTRDAVAETMDTAGKAVLFSGLTVLISLSAVMLVPSPAFRSMALGIMLAVVFVLAATLTLLPAVLARLGSPRRRARPSLGARRRAPLAPVHRVGRAPVAPADGVRRCRPGRAPGAGRPAPGPGDRHAQHQGRALERLEPGRLHSRAGGVRRGCAGNPAGRGTRPARAAEVDETLRADPGIAAVQPAVEGERRQRPGAGRARRRAVGPGRRRHHRAAPGATCRPAPSSAARPRRTMTSSARSPTGPRWSSASCCRWGSCCSSWRCRRRCWRARHGDQPAGDRSGVRRGQADLPGRHRAPASSASSRRASSMPGHRCSSSR